MKYFVRVLVAPLLLVTSSAATSRILLTENFEGAKSAFNSHIYGENIRYSSAFGSRVLDGISEGGEFSNVRRRAGLERATNYYGDRFVRLTFEALALPNSAFSAIQLADSDGHAYAGWGYDDVSLDPFSGWAFARYGSRAAPF